jgi:hypothetical protein
MNVQLTSGDRIQITYRMKRGDEIRAAVVKAADANVSGDIEISFGPDYEAEWTTQSGHGWFLVSRIGAKPFGIQKVEVVGRANRRCR